MEIQYSLLENGLDFILCAVNNITIAREPECPPEGQKRLIKYAVLNLSSGIELIFKVRLLQENWTYVFDDMNKADKTNFENGSFNSVNSKTSVERLEKLCDVKFTPGEKKALEIFRRLRNKIEHFDISESITAIESMMINSLKIVLSFMADQIVGKIAITEDEAENLEGIKKITRSLEKVFEDRKKIIVAEVEKLGIEEKMMICPECSYSFLYFDEDIGETKCLLCDYTDTPDSIAKAYLSNVLGFSEYECAKHGGEYPCYDCFECSEESMIFDYEKGEAYCFNCGYKEPLENIGSCDNCGEPYIKFGEDICICQNCLAYKLSKDD